MAINPIFPVGKLPADVLGRLLARAPALDPAEYGRAMAIAATQGYDPTEVRPTAQSDAVPGMDSTPVRG